MTTTIPIVCKALMFMTTFHVIQRSGTDLLYIDAGTGSIIIQIVLGSLVGGLFLLKVYWGKIRQFFGRHFNSNKKDT